MSDRGVVPKQYFSFHSTAPLGRRYQLANSWVICNGDFLIATRATRRFRSKPVLCDLFEVRDGHRQWPRRRCALAIRTRVGRRRTRTSSTPAFPPLTAGLHDACCLRGASVRRPASRAVHRASPQRYFQRRFGLSVAGELAGRTMTRVGAVPGTGSLGGPAPAPRTRRRGRSSGGGGINRGGSGGSGGGGDVEFGAAGHGDDGWNARHARTPPRARPRAHCAGSSVVDRSGSASGRHRSGRGLRVGACPAVVAPLCQRAGVAGVEEASSRC